MAESHEALRQSFIIEAMRLTSFKTYFIFCPMSKEENPMTLFHNRVMALFAANKTLSSVTKDGLSKFQSSALSFSKYLSTLYIASFLFLLSSHEQIEKVTTSKGSVLWAAVTVLVCLFFESCRTFKLFIGTRTQNYIEDVFEKIKNQLDELDSQGKEDLGIFMDQLIERFIAATLKEKLPFKINLLQKLNTKREEIKDDSRNDSEYMAATNNLIATAEKAKESILESTDKLGKIIGDEFIKTFASMILMGLTFFLYLIGLSIPLFSALIANYETMFSWLIQLIKYVASLF